jgi:glycosyltransferase A (GT-A) superfamily protein (DUF2064 family)
VASAALVDTVLTATAAVGGDRGRVVVALNGCLDEAAGADRLRSVLDGCRIVEQRGITFAQRLGHAHLAAADVHPGSVVVQVGMDTPQCRSDQLVAAAAQLDPGQNQAVVGPAADGGWWLLALTRPTMATVLSDVEMSTPTTGQQTRAALQAGACTVSTAEQLRDVDTWADAVSVAAGCKGSSFADAVGSVSL